MKKQIIGTAYKYPFGGAELLLVPYKGDPFPLLLWKTGPVSALIAEEAEPVPQDRYYVRVACLEGPVQIYDPEKRAYTESVKIGGYGDMVEVYRAGQKGVRFIIWPGWYANWEASQMDELIPDFDDPDFPPDYEETFYER